MWKRVWPFCWLGVETEHYESSLQNNDFKEKRQPVAKENLRLNFNKMNEEEEATRKQITSSVAQYFNLGSCQPILSTPSPLFRSDRIGSEGSPVMVRKIKILPSPVFLRAIDPFLTPHKFQPIEKMGEP